MEYLMYDNVDSRGSKLFIYKHIKNNEYEMIKDLDPDMNGRIIFPRGRTWHSTNEDELRRNSRKLEDWEIVKLKLLGEI